MKDIPSAIDLKRIFNKSNLPTIDITQNTMQKIYAMSSKRSRFSLKRILIVIPLAILMISTTVFAVEHFWSLKGPDATPYTYALESVNGEPKVQALFSKELNSLEPGKALFIFQMKEDVPVLIETNNGHQKFNNLEQFSHKVGQQRFKAPDFLPDGYKFKEANIDLSKISDSFIEELKKGYQNEKQEYFCRIADLDPDNEIIGYSLLYIENDGKINGNSDQNIRVTVSYSWPFDMINERKYDQDATKIKINDFDAILTQWDGMGEIKWLIKGQNTNLYTYISVSSIVAKKDFSSEDIDNLKRVAESIT